MEPDHNGDIQMTDSSIVRVHKHATNSQSWIYSADTGGVRPTSTNSFLPRAIGTCPPRSTFKKRTSWWFRSRFHQVPKRLKARRMKFATFGCLAGATVFVSS